MTEIDVLKKTKDLWWWLSENYPAQKKDYPLYDEIKDGNIDCPLCEYYNSLCIGCPLISCSGDTSLYNSWAIYLGHNDPRGLLEAHKIYIKIYRKWMELIKKAISEELECQKK
jgi:hypothetical protein